jgi:hypothetical protein
MITIYVLKIYATLMQVVVNIMIYLVLQKMNVMKPNVLLMKVVFKLMSVRHVKNPINVIPMDVIQKMDVIVFL